MTDQDITNTTLNIESQLKELFDSDGLNVDEMTPDEIFDSGYAIVYDSNENGISQWIEKDGKKVSQVIELKYSDND